MAEYTQQTDANGLAQFELEYGDYSVTVSYDDITVTQDVAFRKNHKNFPIPVGKGSVTATILLEDAPLENAVAVLCTDHYIDLTDQNPTNIVGINFTGADGTCTLKKIQDMLPTDVNAEVPFGTYYFTALFNTGSSPLITNMLVTVSHSNEVVTATLELPPTATVTLTCVDTDQNVLDGAWVSINDGEWGESTNENGVVTFEDIYYSTFPISASYYSGTELKAMYDGEITIDKETVTKTITLTEVNGG